MNKNEIRELAKVLNNVADEMEKAEKATRVKIYGLYLEVCGCPLVEVSTSKKRLTSVAKEKYQGRLYRIVELENC